MLIKEGGGNLSAETVIGVTPSFSVVRDTWACHMITQLSFPHPGGNMEWGHAPPRIACALGCVQRLLWTITATQDNVQQPELSIVFFVKASS